MDPDDEKAMEWQMNGGTGAPTSAFPPPPPDRGVRDDCYFIPAFGMMDRIEFQIVRIEQETGAHLELRKQEQTIDMWGTREQINEAREKLGHIATVETEQYTANIRANRTKGWAKPDKELTAKEKRRLEREEAAAKLKREFSGQPCGQIKFMFAFAWPTEVPVSRLFGGESLTEFDQIRTKHRVFMWQEVGMPLLNVAGDDQNNVRAAVARVGNLCIKWLRRPDRSVYHVLSKPSKPVRLRFAPPPSGYIPLPESNGNCVVVMRAVAIPSIADTPVANILQHDLKYDQLLEPETKAEPDLQLIQSASATLRFIEEMGAKNVMRMEKLLEEKLDQVQLYDRELTMAVKFGVVAMCDYPKQVEWGIEDANGKVVYSPRLRSDFTPFFLLTESQVGLIRTNLIHVGFESQIDGTWGRTEWDLGVAFCPGMGQGNVQAMISATFRDDGKVALWTMTTENSTLLEIKVIDSERKVSWAQAMEAARILPTDKHLPQGEFVNVLSLITRKNQTEGLLSYANSSAVQIQDATRKRTWVGKFENWKVELVERAIWIRENVTSCFEKFTLSGPPDKLIHSISLTNLAWTDKLTQNSRLEYGYPPEWVPEDFFKDAKDNVKLTMTMAQQVQDALESVIPLTYH